MAPKTPKVPLPVIGHDGSGHLLIRFDRFDPEGVERIKKIPGRCWCPGARAWRVPSGERTESALRRLFPGCGLPAPGGAQLQTRGISVDSAPAPPSGNVEILQEMSRAMVLAGFSPKIRKVYLGYGRRFAEWTQLPLEKAGTGEVRRYLVPCNT